MTTGDPSAFMWAEACALIERAERLQRQFFRPSLAALHAVWEPPVDIYETERELCAIAALPGVEQRDLEISIEGDVLVIAGTRRFPSLPNDAVIHRLEIPHGHFDRRIRVSVGRLRLSRSQLLDGCLVLILTKQV